MRGIKVLGGVCFLLLTIVGLPELITFNFLKPLLLPKISEYLGRPAHIHGNIHVRLVPYVRLIVDRVQIENIKGGHNKDFFTLDALIINVDFVPLLWKKVVANVRITNPHLYLETRSKNQNNWTFGVAQKNPKDKQPKSIALEDLFGGWDVKLQSVKIGDAFVEFRDRKIVDVYEFTTVSLGANALTGPFFINGRLYYHYKKYEFSLRSNRPFGKRAAKILGRFREEGDLFSTLFRGKVITEPFAIKGSFEGRASMLKLKLDRWLLKHLSIRPMTHVLAIADFESTEKSMDIRKLNIKFPLTSIQGTAMIRFLPFLQLNIQTQVPDGSSYLNVKTQKLAQGLTHRFDFKISKMADLLKLYEFATPLPSETDLTFKGDFLQNDRNYVLNETALTLEKGELKTSMKILQLPNNQFRIAAQLGAPDMDQWRRILNVRILPGLEQFQTTFDLSGTSENANYNVKLLLDEVGILETSGNVQQKQIIKGTLSANYKDAKDLIWHINAKRMKEMGPIHVSCNIDSGPNILKLNPLKIDSRLIAGAGTLFQETKGDMEDMSVEMDCTYMDLWNLMNLIPLSEPTNNSKKASENIPSGWSKTPVLWPINRKVNMQLKVQDVSFFQPIIKNAKLSVTMTPDLRLNLQGKSALTQRDCDLTVALNPGKTKHHLSISGFFNQIPIFPFMQLATTAVRFGGGVSAKMDLRTSGLHVDQFMKNLDGYLKIQADRAFIDGYNLRKLSRNPASISGMLFNTIFRSAAEGKGLGMFDIQEKAGENTPVRVLKSDVKIQDGSARLQNTVLDAEGVNGSMDGFIHFAQRTLDIKGKMIFPEIKLKDVPGLIFAVSGPFDNPKSESNLDKFLDYFISNVLANMIGKGIGSLLLNALVPGLGVVVNTVIDQVSDAVDTPPPESGSPKPLPKEANFGHDKPKSNTAPKDSDKKASTPASQPSKQSTTP